MASDVLSEAGVFDRHTPLADVPAELPRVLGRAWLDAESGRCGRYHIAGVKPGRCQHVEDDSRVAFGPPIWRGFSSAEVEETEGGATPIASGTRTVTETVAVMTAGPTGEREAAA